MPKNLKTLNDLSVGASFKNEDELLHWMKEHQLAQISDEYPLFMFRDLVYKSELRQVAIEWLKKDFKIGKRLGIIKKPKYGDLLNPYEIMILRWMHRFNIKLEDLK